MKMSCQVVSMSYYTYGSTAAPKTSPIANFMSLTYITHLFINATLGLPFQNEHGDFTVILFE